MTHPLAAAMGPGQIELLHNLIRRYIDHITAGTLDTVRHEMRGPSRGSWRSNVDTSLVEPLVPGLLAGLDDVIWRADDALGIGEHGAAISILSEGLALIDGPSAES